MRTISLFLLSALAAASLHAASYQKTDGTIVDPILTWPDGTTHSYAGNDLYPTADLAGVLLNNADLTAADLAGANLSGASMGVAKLWSADLTGTDLSGADLTGARLFKADLSNADLQGADLYEADLQEAVLTGINLIGANLESAKLWRVDLQNALLWGAVLRAASLGSAVLADADLTDANLADAHLYRTSLSFANLSGTDLSNVLYHDKATWADAFYYTDNEPTWHSSMDAAWRSAVGILALDPPNAVPEPATLLLAFLGLALLPRHARR